MKILYHHRTLADGAEGIHIREMIDAFRAEGHEVVVQAIVQPPMRGTGHQGVLKQLKAALPEAIFEVAAAGSSLADYVSVSRALRRTRPDFVYKRHALNDFGAVLAARHAGVPLVLEVNRLYTSEQHTRFEARRLKSFCRWCERIAVDGATVVAAVSTPLAESVRALTRHPDRVMVLPNGANPDRFRVDADRRNAVRARLGWQDSVVAAWAGVLREWHGVDLLLHAVSRVPDLKLLIVGDGPERGRLDTLIRELDLVDRVRFTGRVTHDEVGDYLGAADIAVSAADRTGHASPMKLLEYMSMERATVAPKLPNIEDLIDHDVDGVLFAPDDVEALAATLRRLAGDEDLRCAIGRRGRWKVIHVRNWRRNAERVLRAVTDGVAAAPAARSEPRARVDLGVGS